MRYAAICILAALLIAGQPGCVAPAPEPTPVVQVYAFTAQWCEPCKRQRPTIEALQASGVSVDTFDADADRAMLARYGVRSLPTYLVLVDSRELFRTHDAQALKAFLSDLRSP